MATNLIRTREREIIEKLVAWAAYMGGFDAEVWRDAENVLKDDEDCGCTCFECRTGTHCHACMATL